MASARCPVCEDIITFGIPLKLHQFVTCPTCLATLRVVSVKPFELEKPPVNGLLTSSRNNRHNQGKNSKSPVKRRVSDYYGGEDEDNDEEFDDYLLERRLRHKSERVKHKKEESW
jgi:lysine biosynthesis protein LysW